jgi:REP element-mobilizing transposase RayT
MVLPEFKDYYRRNLPHIQFKGSTLFVTFRLANSIPNAVIQRLLQEAEIEKNKIDLITSDKERNQKLYDHQKRTFGRRDKYLDLTKEGTHWLSQPEIAQEVDNSILHRDGKVYFLDTFCIMGNHVHCLFTPLKAENQTHYPLFHIMKSLKGFTAKKANDILGRKGQFWQHENYDHVIRNFEEMNRIRMYIINNPVKAGLCKTWTDWQWTYCKPLS